MTMTISRLMATAAWAVMLSACGGGDGDSGSSTPTSSTTAEQPATITTPAPSPTPTPAPMPTPTPTPTANTQSAPAQTASATPLSEGARLYPPIAAVKAKSAVTLPIGRCVNYAGQLDAEKQAAWMRPVVDADFPYMKRTGFDTLRLPVNFAHSAGPAPGFAIDAKLLKDVHHVVDKALAAGLNVILDNHFENALYTDLTWGKARLTAIWKQLSVEFKDAPANVYFEIWNEPVKPFLNKDIMAISAPALAEIRKNNPTRPVIMSSAWGDDVNALHDLELPDDRYVVPTIHYYDPYEFTHQGAFFTKTALPTGVTFGSAADYAKLDSALAKVKAYIARTGRVPFVGEYGAYEGIPMTQRAKYHDVISHAFASIGIQSCVWGYANSFPIRDEKGWYAAIVDVIGTTTTK